MASIGCNRILAIVGGDESSDSEDDWDICFTKSTETFNQPEKKEETLKKALTAGDVHLCVELLNAGVDVESRYKYGWTPLMYAASVANLEMIRILLDRGANANFKGEFTVLMAACMARSPEDNILKCVEILLSRNANPNTTCRKKMTATMFAAREGHSEVVALLVAHAAEINYQDENGYTALTWAARKGNKHTVMKLLELGADKSLQTTGGKTAGEIANSNKHPELFCMLSLSSNASYGRFQNLSKYEAIYKYLKPSPVGMYDYRSSSFAAFGDVEVFLHGLHLEHLIDMLKVSDITLRQLTMGAEYLEKIGITNVGDQKKIIEALKETQVEEIRFGDLSEHPNLEASSDEFFTFLLMSNRHCNYLTTEVESINKQIRTNPHKIVLEWDETQNFTKVCHDLVCSVKSLGDEICKLRNLLCQLQYGQQNAPCRVPPLDNRKHWRKRLVKKAAVTLFGCGFLFLVTKLSISSRSFSLKRFV